MIRDQEALGHTNRIFSQAGSVATAANGASTQLKACVSFVPAQATCSMLVPDTYMQAALDENALSP